MLLNNLVIAGAVNLPALSQASLLIKISSKGNLMSQISYAFFRSVFENVVDGFIDLATIHKPAYASPRCVAVAALIDFLFFGAAKILKNKQSLFRT